MINTDLAGGTAMFLATKAAANLPQGVQQTLFTISGGKVAMKIYGEVTTVIQTLTNDTNILSNPTAGSSVDLCMVEDITADPVGTVYTITGTFADALQSSVGAITDQGSWVVVPAGTVTVKCSASATGQVKWSSLWFPLDEGASVA